jgi:hypothetical protein
MKRQSKKLSSTLERRLSGYALAASAAGVSALALGPPAEARIIYTPAHETISSGENYSLDLNRDGRTDFIIRDFSATVCNTYTCFRLLRVAPARRVNAVEAAVVDELADALALRRGAKVGPLHTGFYYGQEVDMATVGTAHCQTSCQRGYWLNVRNRYLALSFQVHGHTHYGWARMSIKASPSQMAVAITGYAYETVPNKPIITGKIKGPDVVTVQAGSLGHLARGAAAIPAWRGSD